MDQFLSKYPKWIIVSVALSLGLALIFLLNPPYSKCDAQFEVFKESQTPFVFKDVKKKFNEKTGYQIVSESCRVEGLPGSCLKFFEGLKKLAEDINSAPIECASDISQRSEVRKVIFDAAEVMYKLAWGESAPESYLDKAGWFDTVHLNIYCDVTNLIKENYPKEDETNLREKIIKDLITKSSLDRTEVWNRSLFTIRCP